MAARQSRIEAGGGDRTGWLPLSLHAREWGVCDVSRCGELVQVQDQSNATWEYEIPRRLQEAATPESFMAVIVYIDDMIKDSSKMRDSDWKATKGAQGHAKWAIHCKEVRSWRKVEGLFKTWEENAIDWREVPPQPHLHLYFLLVS